jgi:hypothetical protein
LFVAEALYSLEELPAVLVRGKSYVLTLRQLPLTSLNELSFLWHFVAKTRGWTTNAKAALHEDSGTNTAGKAGLCFIPSDRFIDATLVVGFAPCFLAFLYQDLGFRHQRVLIGRPPINTGENYTHDNQHDQDPGDNQGFGPTRHHVPPFFSTSGARDCYFKYLSIQSITV